MIETLKSFLHIDTASLTRFLIFVVGTLVITYLFSRFYNRVILASAIKVRKDPTSYKFFGHAIIALMYLAGFGLAIHEVEALRSIATSMLAGVSLLAVAIGFASQSVLTNIVSGIFVIIFKPFGVGDRLKVGEKYSGIVEDITLRHTILRDSEGRHVLVPNTIINSEVLINSDYSD